MRETVGLYIRLVDRTYRKVNPKAKTQPEGKFCLRYRQNGKRIWRTVAGTDLNLAIACQRRQEASLLTAAPMRARPEVETRLNVSKRCPLPFGSVRHEVTENLRRLPADPSPIPQKSYGVNF